MATVAEASSSIGPLLELGPLVPVREGAGSEGDDVAMVALALDLSSKGEEDGEEAGDDDAKEGKKDDPRNRPWTDDEDKLVRSLVDMHGTKCWSLIAGRSSRWNLFNALGMHGRRTTAGWRNFPDPLHCMRRLHRAQYELGRWSIQTAGPNAYATTTLQTALLIQQIGGPRASRLLLCVMLAERTLIHAQMRIFETAAAGIRRGLTKLRSQCPSTQNFLCGATAPHPAWDEFTPLNGCSHLENSSDLGHLPGRPRTPGGRAWCPPGPPVRGPSDTTGSQRGARWTPNSTGGLISDSV